MTIVSLGVFVAIINGLALTIVGAFTRTRVVLLVGAAFLLVGLALFVGISSHCRANGC